MIDILVSLEPVFECAGKLALELRKTTKSYNKFDTGIYGVDIVTDADVAIQEMVLAEMAKTDLVECKLFAEESSHYVDKFKETNGLVLTLDPIDCTFVYVSTGRFFSIIVCLNDGKSPIYTYYHYPVVKFTRRIIYNQVQDFGKFPQVDIKNNLDLSHTISTFGHPEKTVPDIYKKLIDRGYIFRDLPEITDESGSCTLFFLNHTAGYYTENIGVYDGLCGYHYAKAKKMEIISDFDMSEAKMGSHGFYYPGWYFVLRK